MESASNKDEKSRAGGINRRTFLAGAGTVGKIAAFFALLAPFSKFVSFTSPKKPKFFKVDRALKKDGFIIEPDFILFDINDEPVAVSRTCTHLGCKLNYHELEKMLICPCHQSRFSKEGKRLAGPAQRNLPTFRVEKTGAEEVTGYIVAVT